MNMNPRDFCEIICEKCKIPFSEYYVNGQTVKFQIKYKNFDKKTKFNLFKNVEDITIIKIEAWEYFDILFFNCNNILPQYSLNAFKTYINQLKTSDKLELCLLNDKTAFGRKTVNDDITQKVIDNINNHVETFIQRIQHIEAFIKNNNLNTIAKEIKKQEDFIEEQENLLSNYKNKCFTNFKQLLEINKDFKKEL